MLYITLFSRLLQLKKKNQIEQKRNHLELNAIFACLIKK